MISFGSFRCICGLLKRTTHSHYGLNSFLISRVHQKSQESSLCLQAFHRAPAGKEWRFEGLNPFGSLVLRTGSQVSYNIKPVDPQENPSQDTAKVILQSIDDENESLDIVCERRDNDILLKTSGKSSEAGPTFRCEINMPIKFSTDAIIGGSSDISLNTFECDSVQVKLESGQCKLRSVQCKNLTVYSLDGEVVSEKSLLGSISIRTASGDVSLNKLIGPSLNIATEEGKIDVTSLYSDVSYIDSSRGDVRLKHCHHKAAVNITEGNLKVGSVDGCLDARVGSGFIDVHIDNPNTVRLETKKGNIVLSLPESLQSDVELQATSLSIDEKFEGALSNQSGEGLQMSVSGSLKGGMEDDRRPYRLEQAKSIKASTSQGSINLKCQDWFSSLNIPGFGGK